MNKDNLSIVAVLVGFAWIFYARQHSDTITQATLPSDVSTNLPFYLSYNVTAPSMMPYAGALPYNASSIQNDPNQSGNCATCSMFGNGWGSQY